MHQIKKDRTDNVAKHCLQFVIMVFPDHTHLLFFSFALNVYVRIRCIVVEGAKFNQHYLDTQADLSLQC